MAYAYCNNEECDKKRWWLQKPPEEYADGGPKCPECGTTRVSFGEPERQDEPEPQTAPQEVESARSAPDQAPARREKADAGQSLATQEEAVQTGAKVGQMLVGLGSDKPEEQAETQGKLFTAAGSLLASAGQELAREKKAAVNRAKNSSDEAIGRVEDYVSCPACETQITELPPAGTQFRCPSCNELLESQ